MTTSPSVAHSIGSRLTDRRNTTFDAELALRALTDDAVTTVAGTYSAPDWASDALDLGNGKFTGRIVLYSFAPTIANVDNTMTFIVQGVAGAVTAPLAEKRIAGAAANWAGSAAVGDSAYDIGDLDLYFANVAFGKRWPSIKLLLINGGTASGFTTGTFGAYVAKIETP